MSYSIDDNDFRPRPPLAGGHQIAQSLVQMVAVVVVVVAMELMALNIVEE